ncbi:MAG: stage II sporulation protein R [Clostridia bacterium]|nr:stage II sporulation protein R [Clostridia bacterium]
MNLKTKMIALICSCFLLLSAVDALVPRSEARIFDNVIRLHILAEDNSAEAQSIKLCVRDAIVEECGDLFSDSGDVIAASEELEANIARMEGIANRVLSEMGAPYTASAEWGLESYPTRVYGDISLPAGEYRSLRIKLGNAEGENWWCILFPPLCTKAASGDIADASINKRDTAVFKRGKYIFRFKLLELFGD